MSFKVVELGGYAAAYAGRLWVRAGADVVRIEGPAEPPAWASDQAMQAYLHAGKRRVATTNTDLICQLANAADVVIGEAPCADQWLALQPERWQTPVVVAITPFGLTGPKRNWLATPSTLLAMGGYTHLMGDPDKAPLTLPGHYLEFQAGGLAYTAGSACLYQEVSEQVDIGMFETLMSLSQFTTVRWHCAGDIRGRHGSDFWFVAPSDLFRCLDGWVYINIVPTFWDACVVMLDDTRLMLDERFQGNDGRMTHRNELRDIIASVFAPMTKVEIERRAVECRVPLGVVRTLADVLQEPHLAQRGFWETIRMGDTQVKSPGVPYCLDDTPRPSRQLQAAEDG